MSKQVKQGNKKIGIILIVIGLVFLVSKLGWFHYSLDVFRYLTVFFHRIDIKIIVPTILILLGIRLISKNKGGTNEQ